METCHNMLAEEKGGCCVALGPIPMYNVHVRHSTERVKVQAAIVVDDEFEKE